MKTSILILAICCFGVVRANAGWLKDRANDVGKSVDHAKNSADKEAQRLKDKLEGEAKKEAQRLKDQETQRLKEAAKAAQKAAADADALARKTAAEKAALEEKAAEKLRLQNLAQIKQLAESTVASTIPTPSRPIPALSIRINSNPHQLSESTSMTKSGDGSNNNNNGGNSQNGDDSNGGWPELWTDQEAGRWFLNRGTDIAVGIDKFLGFTTMSGGAEHKRKQREETSTASSKPSTTPSPGQSNSNKSTSPNAKWTPPQPAISANRPEPKQEPKPEPKWASHFSSAVNVLGASRDSHGDWSANIEKNNLIPVNVELNKDGFGINANRSIPIGMVATVSITVANEQIHIKACYGPGVPTLNVQGCLSLDYEPDQHQPRKSEALPQPKPEPAPIPVARH